MLISCYTNKMFSFWGCALPLSPLWIRHWFVSIRSSLMRHATRLVRPPVYYIVCPSALFGSIRRMGRNLDQGRVVTVVLQPLHANCGMISRCLEYTGFSPIHFLVLGNICLYCTYSQVDKKVRLLIDQVLQFSKQ